MEYSKFGKKFGGDAGILSLMKDMGEAVAQGGDIVMMGGGNPGHIPAFQEKMQRRLQEIAADDEICKRLLGVYSAPQGELDFLSSLAKLLRQEQGWQIGPQNICLTNGSQSGFFSVDEYVCWRIRRRAQQKDTFAAGPGIYRLYRYRVEQRVFRDDSS